MHLLVLLYGHPSLFVTTLFFLLPTYLYIVICIISLFQSLDYCLTQDTFTTTYSVSHSVIVVPSLHSHIYSLSLSFLSLSYLACSSLSFFLLFEPSFLFTFVYYIDPVHSYSRALSHTHKTITSKHTHTDIYFIRNKWPTYYYYAHLIFH